MARKAKLDVLDISIDEQKVEVVPDENKVAGDILSRIGVFIRKPLFWIPVLSAVALGSVVAVSICLYDGQDAIPAVPQSEPVTSGTPVVVKSNILLFAGFVVDLKDTKGNTGIAFCDIALEPENIQDTDNLGKHTGTRSLIYGILKRKKVEELLAAEHRISVKAELKKGLNDLFGGDVVKTVYFSRLEVI